MTSPAEAKSWPQDPTMPSAAPAGYVTPTAPPPNPGEPPMTAGEVEARRGQFIELIFQQVVKAIFGFFSPALGTAFGQVATWASDLASIPQNIINAFTGIGGVIAGPFTGVFDAIFGMLGFTQVAQAAADNANVGVAQALALLGVGGVPGGTLIDDTFSRTGATPGTDYTVTFFGPGVGDPETNGTDLFWNAFGGGDRGAVIMHNTAMTTEYETVAFVTVGDFPVITNPTHLRLVARCDATLNNRVEAYAYYGGCRIDIVVAGVATTLDTQAVTTAAGDRWTLKVGTATDVREFILYQNTTPVITITDTGGTSQFGPGFELTGLVMYANTQFVPPFFFTQIGCPSLQLFTAYDRLPTA